MKGAVKLPVLPILKEMLCIPVQHVDTGIRRQMTLELLLVITAAVAQAMLTLGFSSGVVKSTIFAICLQENIRYVSTTRLKASTKNHIMINYSCKKLNRIHGRAAFKARKNVVNDGGGVWFVAAHHFNVHSNNI